MNALLFVETRNIPNLKFHLERHLKLKPEGWDVAVLCSDDNAEQFEGYDKFIVENPNNLYRYNVMMTSSMIWSVLPFDYVLLIEHESGILRYGIEEFIKYDYVGSPWKFQQHGGNGGFSLRKVDTMLEVTKRFKFTGGMNEDVWFSNNMFENGFNIAPRDICKKFACETIFELGTYGYHAINKYFNDEQLSQIYNQYEKL
jgi:hypothetical protein